MDMKSMAKRFNEAADALGGFPDSLLKSLPLSHKASAFEIQLRAGSPLMLGCASDDLFVFPDGTASPFWREGAVEISPQRLQQIFAALCGYSVHSVQKEIQSGFVTLRGGHRAGICGTAVVENGKVVSIRDISSIHLRIARQFFGAADPVIRQLRKTGVQGLLLAGPPSCGKTTVLRDLARQLSEGAAGRRLRVAVADERGEICGVWRGAAQNRMGFCCDTLDGYPKAEGILHAVRCLSPDVVICDEIGTEEELDAVRQGVHSGVTVMASVHAGSRQELRRKLVIQNLLETGAFERIALMEGRQHPGRIHAFMEAGELIETGRTASDYRSRGGGGIFEIDGILEPGEAVGSGGIVH
ncbi:MAG: Flp pilus assembly complex ATPase component TadA [Clostridiales bacterium]|nr:Flp pilus assembly complex ATPase component TadA [Clostridiales bacterium]